MTLEEANKIAYIWGIYQEYAHGKLSIIFGPHIPESFLPFSLSTLEEALNIVAQHYYEIGDREAVAVLQSGISLLTWYVNDKDSIVRFAELFAKPEWRETMVSALGKYKNHKTRAHL